MASPGPRATSARARLPTMRTLVVLAAANAIPEYWIGPQKGEPVRRNLRPAPGLSRNGAATRAGTTGRNSPFRPKMGQSNGPPRAFRETRMATGIERSRRPNSPFSRDIAAAAYATWPALSSRCSPTPQMLDGRCLALSVSGVRWLTRQFGSSGTTWLRTVLMRLGTDWARRSRGLLEVGADPRIVRKR